MFKSLLNLLTLIPPIKHLYEQKLHYENISRELEARLHGIEYCAYPTESKEWLLIDRENGWVYNYINGNIAKHSITDLNAFYEVAEDYLRIGWFNKHYATFTWLGTPLFQYPEDIVRWQELIWRVKPDVIIETGIYKGGSLLLTASICRLIGNGRVIGVDINVPEEVRTTLEEHFLSDLITVYEGSSTEPMIYSCITESIKPDDVVLVILDSDHTKSHVFTELELYAPLVNPDSYIFVCDGIMRDLAGKGEGAPLVWLEDNPYQAAKQFAEKHGEFEWEEPLWIASYTGHKQIVAQYFAYQGDSIISDGYRTRSHTYCPGAYLRKKYDIKN